MRVLGLDVGSRRIGVALTDALGIAAHALRTIERHGDAKDSEVVAAIVAETGAVAVVVGWPLTAEGEEGPAARRMARFAERLRTRLGAVPVHLQDESYTTVEAERVLLQADLSRAKRRKVIDRLAAAHILQAWLDASRAGALPR